MVAQSARTPELKNERVASGTASVILQSAPIDSLTENVTCYDTSRLSRVRHRAGGSAPKNEIQETLKHLSSTVQTGVRSTFLSKKEEKEK